MAEALGRPSTDFGLWFVLSPIALFTGNFLASRIGTRVPGEVMVLTGAAITALAIFGQALAFSFGELSPLLLFVPCHFVSLAQGLSMPYAQAGAISTISKLSGTAAGLAIFVHSIVGAIFAQAYGYFADGSVWPMVSLAGGAALGALCAAAAAAAIRSRR